MTDAQDTNSQEKLLLKDYSRFSNRKLNKILRLRERQIANYEQGKPTTDKRITQLKYEREAIMNTLLERAMTK